MEEKVTCGKLIKKIQELEERPSWNEYFMMVATMISKRSSCDRLQVGCVIIDDNRIVSTGYNGHIKGTPHISKVENGHEQMTIHAEMNAIADSASRGMKIYGTTAYITHYPCIHCIKSLIAAGIKEIYYNNDYKNNKLCSELVELAKIKLTKLIILE